MRQTIFHLCAAETDKKGPVFWGYVEEDNPKPLMFTVYSEFYQTLLNECDGNFEEADIKAIGYALRFKGYDTKNLKIETKEGVIYE